MVEFITGKNIKAAGDKVLIAEKAAEIVRILSDKEQILADAVKKQTEESGIKVYNLGGCQVVAVVIKKAMSGLEMAELAGKIYKSIKNCRVVKVDLIDREELTCDFAFGIELASYTFDKYFTAKPESFYPKLERIIFTGIKDMTDYKPLSGVANAVRYARDLINEPANYLTPEVFAADIRRLEYLGLDVKILDEKAMKERGFGLALAVAQGSVNKPRVAVIKWKGNKESDDFTIGLVGKGVTFDSGGISIKPAAGMGDMKQDMAGAAAMVAVMKSLALQQTQKNVVAVVGLVENMPSGSAYRPGDIFRSMSGQTVEVQNTDAEGRLVLADCLTYIQEEYKPEYVVDMATLTGAIVIALGHSYAGLFSNNAKLTKALNVAGEHCGELLWQLPMNAEFNKQMDSTVADMKNVGGRAAGSCTAACFLQRFVKKETKWAHIDIAGMDLVEEPKPLYPKGASGYGVRLINQFINEL